MSTATASKLDIEKFRKVHALMKDGATEGERKSARAAATRMAKKAGLTLMDAVCLLYEPPAAKPRNIFEEFFNSPEMKAERAERERERAILRAAALEEYGSIDAVWADTERETLLSKAVDHLKEWSDWKDENGESHPYVSSLDGMTDAYWLKNIPISVQEAVKGAYPFPTTLRGALEEYNYWDKLSRDRYLFDTFEHWRWTEARITLLRNMLEEAPAANWDDMDARMDWWQVVLDWQSHQPIEYEQAFKDRVTADLIFLRGADHRNKAHAQNGRRTNSDKAAAVTDLLNSNPELSDREISRRVGVSPQTVCNWRARMRNREQSKLDAERDAA